MSVQISNCAGTRKIPSQSLKNNRPLWLVMMDDSAPTHDRSNNHLNFQVGMVKKYLYQDIDSSVSLPTKLIQITLSSFKKMFQYLHAYKMYTLTI